MRKCVDCMDLAGRTIDLYKAFEVLSGVMDVFCGV